MSHKTNHNTTRTHHMMTRLPSYVIYMQQSGVCWQQCCYYTWSSGAPGNVRETNPYTQRASNGPQLAPHKCTSCRGIGGSPSSRATSSWPCLSGNPFPGPLETNPNIDEVRPGQRQYWVHFPSAYPGDPDSTGPGKPQETAKNLDRMVKLCTGQASAAGDH